MKAVSYLRVSTREQSEGYSLAAQRNAIARYLDDHDWTLDHEFCDAGESARSANRTEYQALLRYIEHADVDVLIAHKLDRLARNLEDHAALRARLRQAGIQLVSVTESLEDSPSGKLIEGILASLNEFYAANLGHEVRKGQLQKLREGGWPGHAPIGYRNVRSEHGHGPAVLAPDDDQAPLVRQAFELYATGAWPITALQAEMHRRGLRTRTGKPVVRSRFAHMLHNPIYVGRLRWDGIEYPGTHTALVTPALFERVQTMLDANANAGERRRRNTHPLKGLLVCDACGARLTITVAKGRFPYFFCLGTQRGQCNEPYVPVANLDTTIEQQYRALRVPARLKRELADELDALVARQRADGQTTLVTTARRVKQLEREGQRVMDAYYAEAIDADQLRVEQRRIATETAQAKALQIETRTELERVDELVDAALTQADNLFATFLNADPAVRRLLNQAVFRSVAVRDRAIVRIDFQPPFRTRTAV